MPSSRRRDFRAAANKGNNQPPSDNAPSTSEAVVVHEGPTDPSQVRAQPFTMEHWGLTLPDVDATPETAHGPLDEQEQRLLAEAHRAVDNARTASWMLGFALEAVRRRRLYRGDGTRTWEQYLDAEHDGLSTSEADRLQKTWRLARTVQKALGRPMPGSHLRKLKPYADSTSDEEAARAYVELYRAHQEGEVRLVASQVEQRVRDAIAAAKGVSDPGGRTRAVSAAWVAAPETPMPAQRVELESGQGSDLNRSSDPVDAALRLLDAARQAVEDATEDKKARGARSSEGAQRQQAAIRRIGRILAKVKVESDHDTIDGEVIVDVEVVEG
ncbi:hypothetical protein ACWCXX_24670 [Streptomyces sp. NPDC001732]